MKESAFQSEPRVPESVIRHSSTSPTDKSKGSVGDGRGSDEERPKKSSLCRNVEGCREQLQSQVGLALGSQAAFPQSGGAPVLLARLHL